MKFDRILIYIAVITIHCSIIVVSYRYLGILPTPAKSHFIFGSALLRALAEDGHEVYVISMFSHKVRTANYHEVSLARGKLNFNVTKNYTEIKSIDEAQLEVSERILRHPNVKHLMWSNLKFDAVICEAYNSEALFAFSEHFEAPLIVLGPIGATTFNSEMIGSPTPTAYVPYNNLVYSDRMSFMERVRNLLEYIFKYFDFYFMHLPHQSTLYKRYFPHLKRDLYTVRKNAAILLLNTHVSLSYPRPYVANQIEVGGMHINPRRKPLPNDIATFINEAEHGVIYFAVGTLSRNLPDGKQKEFLNAFKSLKQRVLWKLEEKYLQGQQDNIYISKWFPKNGILGHKNVKVFVTHCDILSVIESIYHGKPIIGIRTSIEHFPNIARVESRGFGIGLNLSSLQPQNVIRAVERIIKNKTYTENAKELSRIYRDQPISPLDLAVFWSEYVVRQKGANYLRRTDEGIFRFYNIYMVAFYTALISVICLCLAVLLRVAGVWRAVII